MNNQVTDRANDPPPASRQGSSGPIAEVEDVALLVGRLARRCNPPLLAPVLALGVFERVGSNWLSDVLRSVMPQHNEPFRQQLSRAHPLTPSHRVPLDLRGTELSGLGRHQLVCALSDLHGRPRHLVKETNLFFALDSVLGLLPRSPVLLLTRAPVGIASSFTRGGLWARWHYAERYAQVVATARAPRHRARFAGLFPQDDPAPATALGRLLALNTLLLADALTRPGTPERARLVLPYEDHVINPAATRSALARFLELPPFPAERPSPDEGAVHGDGTFATTGTKERLVAELPVGQADEVRSAVASVLESAAHSIEPGVVNTATGWLAGDDQYELRTPAPHSSARTRRVPASRPLPRIAYPPAPGVRWRNLLVSNTEMAELLTLLHAGGAPNSRFGTHLFVCPMPHERGGRLHFDRTRRVWRASRGFEDHPAYWVTWAGAAVMAAWSGARLPTRPEVIAATAGLTPRNCAYVEGDTTPVAEPGRGSAQVHHAVGNVQAWCGDGPTLPDEQPVQRYLAGAAWNTPGTRQAVCAERSRYLLGSSRGVGVRLVRDAGATDADRIGAWELARRVSRWAETADRGGHRGPGDLDRRLLDALGS